MRYQALGSREKSLNVSGWSGPWLSAYARRHVFAWPDPYGILIPCFTVHKLGTKKKKKKLNKLPNLKATCQLLVCSWCNKNILCEWWWLGVCCSFQYCLSHIETMEGWWWKGSVQWNAVLSWAKFRLQRNTNPRPLDPITKTRIFKYIEKFTTKNWKFSDKNSDIFHISAQKINCGYSLEPLCRGGSNEYPQSMFLSRNKKK